MTEIRFDFDSATLHVYVDEEQQHSMTGSQIGERQSFEGRSQVIFSPPGDKSMRVYAVLWRGDLPVTSTYPDWVHPGNTYVVDQTVVVQVDNDDFVGKEFFDYYDAPTAFCKWPRCNWRKTVRWGEQEAAFKKHFQAEHAGTEHTGPIPSIEQTSAEWPVD